MLGKYEAPRKSRKFHISLLLILLTVLVAAGLFLRAREPEIYVSEPEDTEARETSSRETSAEPVLTGQAVIAAQGDLLMHATFFQEKYKPACRLEDGTLDFSSLFRYMKEYVAQADYAVANLETTLGGDEFPYQGNPSFNCPDAIVDAVETAGYDLLLTANNHSYDTLMAGVDRTLHKVREAGLDTLGTRLNGEEPRYQIREINGIRIGMVSYTYTMEMHGKKPRLNDNSPVEKPEQINFFSYGDLNGFYTEMQQIMEQMQSEGAEATVLFIHWGTEYETVQNSTQETIGQKMCDLGFDVIIGGHPHVVQPMELLQSSRDPAHRTVCIYSLGNAVSNQRRDLMRLNTGHTEDGALVTVTFEKYSDGTVRLADADVLPTWVNLYENGNGRMEYSILPLDISRQEQWKETFRVSDSVIKELQNSWQRTMDIVGPGRTRCRNFLNPEA